MSKIGLAIIGTVVKIYIAILLILLITYVLRKLTTSEKTTITKILTDIGVIIIFPIATFNNIMWNRLVNIFKRRK